MPDKKILYGLLVLVLIVSVLFLFKGEDKMTNYPSLGTDIVVFGDSLVEGVGASSPEKSFVSVLSKKIGRPIINLGVSGNTTEDGLARVSLLDKYKPKVVLVLLGGNDHLRKVPIDVTFNNLEKIIKNIQDRGAIVVLLGIRGGLFSDNYEARFEKLSHKYHTAYVSDVLDGLFSNNKYMSDAVHPNDLGYGIIAERIYPTLSKLIK